MNAESNKVRAGSGLQRGPETLEEADAVLTRFRQSLEHFQSEQQKLREVFKEFNLNEKTFTEMMLKVASNPATSDEEKKEITVKLLEVTRMAFQAQQLVNELETKPAAQTSRKGSRNYAKI